MAIVREIASGTAVVKIDDSCCRDITREEAARRWAEVERVILMIDEKERERRTSSVSADGAATFPTGGRPGNEERRARACGCW